MVAQKKNKHTEEAGPKNSVFNIANMLTVIRVLMVPLFVAAFAMDGRQYGVWRWIALGIFCLAIYTDLLDGDLARSRNMITDFGKIADPMADKVLIGSALVMLSFEGELSWWVTFIILGRELIVTILRLAVLKRGVIAASRGGKIKTLTQTIATFLYLIPWMAANEDTLFYRIAEYIMAAALLLSLATALLYAFNAWTLVRGRPRIRSRDDSLGSEVQHLGESVRVETRVE